MYSFSTSFTQPLKADSETTWLNPTRALFTSQDRQNWFQRLRNSSMTCWRDQSSQEVTLVKPLKNCSANLLCPPRPLKSPSMSWKAWSHATWWTGRTLTIRWTVSFSSSPGKMASMRSPNSSSWLLWTTWSLSSIRPISRSSSRTRRCQGWVATLVSNKQCLARCRCNSRCSPCRCSKTTKWLAWSRLLVWVQL